MTKGTTPPYADRGKRLRARRLQLQKAGRLDAALVKLAKRAGVSVSGFQQWERGETWPRQQRKAKLAAIMEWSEVELDHGPQGEAERAGAPGMHLHPLDHQEMEFVALLRALEEQEQHKAMDWLRSRVATRQKLQEEVPGKLRVVSDAEVEQRMPVAKRTPVR